jgi:hypothetical protein
MSYSDSPVTLRSRTQADAIAAELAAEVLQRPAQLAQYERSLVAIVVVVARKHPGLAARAAATVRALLEEANGETVECECESTPSGNWRAA